MIPMIRAIPHLLRSLLDGTTIAVAQTGTASGSAVVAPANGSFTTTRITVTNVSQSLIAANANRRYLMIQNKDAGGSIWIQCGTPVTTLTGILLTPGASWEPGFMVPSDALHFIGDIASNINVIVVESQ